jgi:Na+-driven multidrug efflux pump
VCFGWKLIIVDLSLSLSLSLSLYTGLTTAVILTVAIGVYFATSAGLTGRIFSNDPLLLASFADIALPFSGVCVCMPLSVSLERVLLAMGRARAVLIVGVLGSWMFQVPLAFVFTRYTQFQTPIFRLFLGVFVGYAAVCVLMTTMIVTADWSRYAAEAAARAEKDESVALDGGATTDTNNNDNDDGVPSVVTTKQ